ncbi:mechanosensitive ion channel family protein [Streptococcus sp.]|nr:mechanosensitive ion channel family protein [Streptococcus sp.]MDY3823496.1 mechanosensitive ion channel family protein [Streptococcus sp.]
MTFITKYWNSLDIESLAISLTSKLLAIIALLIAYSLVKRFAHYAFKKTIVKSVNFSGQTKGRQETLIKLSQNVMDYTLGFFVLYWILSLLGLPISSLLAGAGIAGIAVGLGAQGFLTDLVNGFFILFERQFDVGDSIQVSTITGTVTSVGLRTTQVKSVDGTVYFIPNRNITIVGNQSRGQMKAQIDLPLPFDSDLEQVTDIIHQVNQKEVGHYPEIIGSPIILGGRTTTTGTFVFRIDIITENGKQNEIYYTFYKLYQEALKEQNLITPSDPVT